MRELTRAEVVAMWLWGDDYARSGQSAIDWLKHLPPNRVRIVNDFMKRYESAGSAPTPETPAVGSPPLKEDAK